MSLFVRVVVCQRICMNLRVCVCRDARACMYGGVVGMRGSEQGKQRHDINNSRGL